MLRFFLLFALLFAAPAFARDNAPDPKLTPGKVETSDLALVCKHGYSEKVRRTTPEMKQQVYRAYGFKTKESRKGYKIDHLVPLALGGADSVKNLWPSNKKAEKYSAGAKDRLELKVREMVCRKELGVKEGQRLFLTNWREAYDRYCPTREACPSYIEIQEKGLTGSFHYDKNFMMRRRGGSGKEPKGRSPQ